MKKTFGLDRSTPTELVLRFCKLYPLELRYNLKLYVFVYRCLSQLASPLLQQLFVLRCHGSHSSAATRVKTLLHSSCRVGVPALVISPYLFSRQTDGTPFQLSVARPAPQMNLLLL